jgi:hypothetical protein
MAGFRQPGDLGRYVAFNDPGQPGAGFSSYEEYLNAGNKPFNTSGILQPATLSGISSGLRRNDGSIVEGTTGNLPTTVNNQSMNRGPSTNSIFAMIPEQGPLGPGLVGGTTPQTGINLPGNRGTPMGGNFTLTFGGGLSSLNQQPQQMNGGIRSLLDSYIGNYINNYFKNALR